MKHIVEAIEITCDNCKEQLIHSHYGWAIWTDMQGAYDAMDYEEWYNEDGKHYCPKCFRIDDEDNLVLIKK